MYPPTYEQEREWFLNTIAAARAAWVRYHILKQATGLGLRESGGWRKGRGKIKPPEDEDRDKDAA